MTMTDKELRESIKWIKDNHEYLFRVGFSHKETVGYIITLLEEVKHLRSEIIQLKER